MYEYEVPAYSILFPYPVYYMIFYELSLRDVVGTEMASNPRGRVARLTLQMLLFKLKNEQLSTAQVTMQATPHRTPTNP